MDYTDLDRVKTALGATESSDDNTLLLAITAASRAIDRHCAGATLGSDNYFALADVTEERIHGQVRHNSSLACWPRKAAVNSVSALAYRYYPWQAWTEIDADYTWSDGAKVVAFVNLTVRQRVQVQVSYSGGFGATVATLPADLVEAATVLAIRYYREAATGLADSIGVAELGTLMYTKALPVRVLEMLRHYRRAVPW